MVSEKEREGIRRRNREYKARQKGKPKSEKHREGNRRRNKIWKENNPEHVAALNREKVMTHYLLNHESVKEKMRDRANRRWAKLAPDEWRDLKLRQTYGISLAEFNVLLQAQHYKCCGCLTDTPGSKGWFVDHCHTTNRVRGILCQHCNSSLGFARDNPETLERLADYLRR